MIALVGRWLGFGVLFGALFVILQAAQALTAWTAARANHVAFAATGTSNDAQRGRAIYQADCASCHGADGEGGFGPSLRGLGIRLSLDQTIAVIEHPAGPMPALYPDTLSATQVDDVARYVRETFTWGDAAHAGSNGRPYPDGRPYGMGPGMMRWGIVRP